MPEGFKLSLTSSAAETEEDASARVERSAEEAQSAHGRKRPRSPVGSDLQRDTQRDTQDLHEQDDSRQAAGKRSMRR